MGHAQIPSQDEFVRWLKSNRLAEVVGHAGDDHDCPLARWLTALWNARVVVGTESALVGPYPAADVQMPPWAKAFVLLIDNESEEEAVTARQALAFLAKAVK